MNCEFAGRNVKWNVRSRSSSRDEAGATAVQRSAHAAYTPPSRRLPPAYDRELEPGALLGGTLRIGQRLAAGGMGVVYVATHERIPGLFAVKTIPLGSPDVDELAARLRQEARVLARVQHPHVVRLFNCDDTASGTPYLVMEYLEGCDLGDLLRTGPLPPGQAVAVVKEIAEALAAAHACDVVHRDLKPENVMIVSNPGRADSCKLIDFGASKVTWSAGVTTQGQLIGTPYYMAPEQVQGDGEVGAKADQFALAMMTYEMLTGKLPFFGQDAMAIMRRILSEEIPPLGPNLAWTPTAVEPVLRRALRKDPRGRFAGVRQFADALGAAMASDLGGIPERVRLLQRSDGLAAGTEEAPGPGEAAAGDGAAPALRTPADDGIHASPGGTELAFGGWPAVRPWPVRRARWSQKLTPSLRGRSARTSLRTRPRTRLQARRRSGRVQRVLAAVAVGAAILCFSAQSHRPMASACSPRAGARHRAAGCLDARHGTE
jgi:hypothetical protein